MNCTPDDVFVRYPDNIVYYSGQPRNNHVEVYPAQEQRQYVDIVVGDGEVLVTFAEAAPANDDSSIIVLVQESRRLVLDVGRKIFVKNISDKPAESKIDVSVLAWNV